VFTAEKVNRRNTLARNSLFFDNREFDHREQGISVFETAICFRVSEKPANPGWVHMLAARRDAKPTISILAGGGDRDPGVLHPARQLRR